MFVTTAERPLIKRDAEDGGRKVTNYAPNSFRQAPRLMIDESGIAFVCTVSPADRRGRFSFGAGNDYSTKAARSAKRLMVEGDVNMPRVYGVGAELHVSEVDAVPEGDLYLLKYILHDWDDALCVRILRNSRRGLRPGGRVAIVELLLGVAGQSALAPLMDLNMLVMLPRRERTLDEYRDLFVDGGLGKVTFIPTNTLMVILTATAA